MVLMVTRKLTDILMEYRLRSVSKVWAGCSNVIIFGFDNLMDNEMENHCSYSGNVFHLFSQQDSSLTNLSMGSNNFTPEPSRLPSVNNRWLSSLQGTYGRSLL